MPSARRLEGQLNRAALEQSLQTLVQRHETLRTTFQTVEGQPQIVVSPVEDWSLNVIDWPDAESLINEEAQRPFDLEKGPLFRATLLQLGVDSHVLLLTMHHIISDGWSIGILNRELSTLYNAISQGQPSPLPPLPIQYADYAHWQRQWLTGDLLETQLNYWKKQLAGAPALLELPTDHPRPPIQHYRGQTASLQLSPELTQQLKNLSQQAGTTLFMTLLAAFATLLSRYSGQSDLVIGSPIANRTHHQTESLIGLFLNTLALRIDLSGNPRVDELLRRIRQVALDAYAHQDIPFEKLVEELQPERSLSHSPLFQVMLVFQNTPTSAFELDGITLTPLKNETLTTKFDLNFHWGETPQGLWGNLFYNSELFNKKTITWMLGQFQTLLENLVTAPEKRLSSLRLLTETERHHLSTRGNLVHPTNPFIEFEKREQTLPARFEQQVRKSPEQIAVKTKRYTWTYRDLNDKANQVAQALLEPAKEERVALLFEPDAPMLVGIMGVLKAGKTYVPLDPDLPSERLEYLVQDSQASAILTNDLNLSLAQALTSNTLRLINLDEIKLVASRDEIQSTLSADSIAYILYTSGSTGQPKGVLQNHRNVLHFIRNYTNNLHITTNDKLTLLSSYSFDAAMVDIFAALLNGATLYPINLFDTNLAPWLIEQNISLYHSTPTVYRHWINNLTNQKKFPSLRLVVLGGEAVEQSEVECYRNHFANDCFFVNLFGSTESSINSFHFINHQTEITHQAVPVGYPVEETEVLLLNEAGEETDIYGEIVIKSPYLALGYWQKPEITRAVFITDGNQPRFYRTGDMGRLRADGSIEFVGRKDFQVKLRGFRIELGEIEAVLSQHPAVQETVVRLREEPAGEKRLVAYWVSNQALATDTIELRRFLQEKLPNYMIP
ncbi:non-ribosomal peptide synthetase, partial [Candidatus Thiomargarita nelsonii]